MIHYILASITIVLFFIGMRVLLLRGPKCASEHILGIMIMNRVSLNVLYLMAAAGLLVDYPYLLKVSGPLYYLSPALLFFYLRSLVRPDIGFSRRDVIHFLPAFLGLLEVLPWYLKGYQYWLEDVGIGDFQPSLFFTRFSGPLSHYTGYFVKPVLQFIYLGWIYILARQSDFFRDRRPETKYVRMWVTFILIMFLLSQILVVVQIAANGLSYWVFTPGPVLYKGILVLNILLLSLFLFFIFQHPEILSSFVLGYRPGKENRSDALPVGGIPFAGNLAEIDVYQHADTAQASRREVLDVSEAEALLLNAEILMTEKALYRNREVHVASVASELGVPVHHLSFCLNKFRGVSFRDWINGYRIEAFLRDYPALNTSMTIEGQAFKCGFNTTSGFYQAFRKHKGCSPKEYFSS
jgi:AraC-like DNA-binding protein